MFADRAGPVRPYRPSITRTTRPQTRNVEQIRPEACRLFIRFDRQGAMNARWPVHDRVNAAAAAAAALMAVKAGALKKNRRRLTGLLEAEGAAERQT